MTEYTTATTSSNDELVGRIMTRAFKTTWGEWDALGDVWFAIPYDDRRAALVGGDAVGGGLDGAFALLVDAVSSDANTYLGASLAVLARDSRSESGPFTPAHYEVLTRPWRRVIGAVHPDDDLPTGDDVVIANDER